MKNFNCLAASLVTFAVVCCCSNSAMADGEEASLLSQTEKALAQRDFQTAYSLADKSIKLKPSALGYMLRAKAAIEQNKFTEANKDATDSIALNPKLFPAYIVRCMARKSLGDSKGSLGDAKKAAELDPSNMFWLSATAMMEYEGQDFKGSLEHYNQAIMLLSADTRQRAVAPGSGSGITEPGIKTAKQTEFSVSLFSGRGEANAMLGNFKDALTDYNEAIALDISKPKFFVNRGAVKDELGDHKGAVLDYDAALKLKPNDGIAYKMRSEAKKDLGDAVGAASDLEKANNLITK